jgi:two-component sensor histidine kinase
MAGLNDPLDQDHLARLIGSWGILADLSFSDLLLIEPHPRRPGAFLVRDQIRPNTGRTLHPEDLVGHELSVDETPLVRRAWTLGAMLDDDDWLPSASDMTHVECIPVRRSSRTLAILLRRCSVDVRPGLGRLERAYLELFRRFALMVYEGSFPYAAAEEPSESPRVGDGLVVFGTAGDVRYISPNANTAWRRLGMKRDLIQRRAGELGIELDLVTGGARHQPTPVHQEIERNGVTLACRHLPLLRGGACTGVVTLVRDVSELRSRDRLLTSKDATIREIHHRVKNNLQTISSLLHLQARRIGAPEARSALADAERRVRAIALVHEVLSREVVGSLDFGDVAAALARWVEESTRPEQRVELEIIGHSGRLSAEIATPLAVVVAELVQNALEHGFPGESDGVDRDLQRRVTIQFTRSPTLLTVVVSDNGVGLPSGFSLAASASLGLSLVHSLVTSQLEGEFDMGSNRSGTTVRLTVPLRDGVASRPVEPELA